MTESRQGFTKKNDLFPPLTFVTSKPFPSTREFHVKKSDHWFGVKKNLENNHADFVQNHTAFGQVDHACHARFLTELGKLPDFKTQFVGKRGKYLVNLVNFYS